MVPLFCVEGVRLLNRSEDVVLVFGWPCCLSVLFIGVESNRAGYISHSTESFHCYGNPQQDQNCCARTQGQSHVGIFSALPIITILSMTLAITTMTTTMMITLMMVMITTMMTMLLMMTMMQREPDDDDNDCGGCGGGNNIMKSHKVRTCRG